MKADLRQERESSRSISHAFARHHLEIFRSQVGRNLSNPAALKNPPVLNKCGQGSNVARSVPIEKQYVGSDWQIVDV